MNSSAIHSQIGAWEIDGSDGSGSVKLSFEAEMFVWTGSVLAIDNATAVAIEAVDRAGVHAEEDFGECRRSNGEDVARLTGRVIKDQGLVRANVCLTVDRTTSVVSGSGHAVPVEAEEALGKGCRSNGHVRHIVSEWNDRTSN